MRVVSQKNLKRRPFFVLTLLVTESEPGETELGLNWRAI
jgi:hypothetical protein